jgi:hypothetical protein
VTRRRPAIGAASVVMSALAACAHAPVSPLADEPGVLSSQSIKRGRYELVFVNKDPALSPATRERMIEAFFKVYPAEAARFNPAAPAQVTFVIDTDYRGGAAAGTRNVVRFNASRLRELPRDLDVVTHELMHVVGDYAPDIGPEWLVEGIADYGRYRFGIDNAGGDWSLPDVTEHQHYTDSYRVMARFLIWLEARRKPDLVKTLDAALRAKRYTPQLWARETGASLDELWAQYVADPAIP